MQDICMNSGMASAMMSMHPIISKVALDAEKRDFEADGDQESMPAKLSSDEFRKRILDIRKNIRLLAG